MPVYTEYNRLADWFYGAAETLAMYEPGETVTLRNVHDLAARFSDVADFIFSVAMSVDRMDPCSDCDVGTGRVITLDDKGELYDSCEDCLYNPDDPLTAEREAREKQRAIEAFARDHIVTERTPSHA